MPKFILSGVILITLVAYHSVEQTQKAINAGDYNKAIHTSLETLLEIKKEINPILRY